MSGRDKAQGVSSHSTASASAPTVTAQTSHALVKRLRDREASDTSHFESTHGSFGCASTCTF